MTLGPKVDFRSVLLTMTGAMLCCFACIAFPQSNEIETRRQEVFQNRQVAASPVPDFADGW